LERKKRGVDVPSAKDLERASHRIRGKVLRSPLVFSECLSTLADCEAYLKLDSLQPGGSFKIRGATNAVAMLSPAERKRGVVAASSGNYGTALALAAKKEGIEATIVLPENAPSVKVERIRQAGARILRYGAHYGDSEEKAAELAENGRVLIHPFDDPRVVAGQGTIGLEINEQAPAELGRVVVPVGGGGLIAGVALGLKSTRPEVEVIGVEPYSAPSLTEALKACKPVAIQPQATCADGLSPRFTGDISYAVACERIHRIELLTEDELIQGSRYCFHNLRVVVEPSGAAGVAALVSGKISGGETTVVVVSGSNLDRKYFSEVLG
jgi:threonine dehydratase